MRKMLLVLSVLLSAAVAFAQKPALQEGLVLKYLVQPPVDKSTRPPVIILLHGYGSDERDLFELKSLFPARYLVIAARAPYAVKGGSGYQWFEGTTVAGNYQGKPEELASSRAKILAFIGEVVNRYEADGARVYVAGFSQGAIMSYEVGLTAPGRVAGIAPLSGKIFPSLKPLVKNTPELKRLKIFIAHGTADNRIAFADGKAANDWLKSIGLATDFHAYEGMGHSISNEVMKDLVEWLKR